jgi:uncharacterized membrane protein
MSSKKNELPVLLGALVITLGILAAGYWWLTRGTNNPLQNWLYSREIENGLLDSPLNYRKMSLTRFCLGRSSL